MLTPELCAGNWSHRGYIEGRPRESVPNPERNTEWVEEVEVFEKVA